MEQNHVAGWEIRAGVYEGKAALFVSGAADAKNTVGGVAANGSAIAAGRAPEIEVLELNGGALLRAKAPAMGRAVLAVPGARLWDCEHPFLYTLRVLPRGDAPISRKIGFAQIEKSGGQVLWNGRALKLRGANYREPALGERMREDLGLLRGAHVNYLRSMFRPFSEACLSACDELGVLVEQCAPFWGTVNGRQDSPAQIAEDVDQWRSLVLAGRDHPCVLIWTCGSDSTWGANFRAMREGALALDPGRLHSFHFPMTIPEEEAEPDVWSVAHVDYRQRMDARLDHMAVGHTHGARNEIGYAVGCAPQSKKPVLHVAFAHLPCHNRDEIERDMAVREFWGESVLRFSDAMWRTQDCLGGALMAAVDEDGAADPKYRGYEWGLLDREHRPKPELFHARMAFCPVRLQLGEIDSDGLPCILENRFLHTSLSELEISWSAGGQSGRLACDAGPGESVRAVLPICAQAAKRGANHGAESKTCAEPHGESVLTLAFRSQWQAFQVSLPIPPACRCAATAAGRQAGLRESLEAAGRQAKIGESATAAEYRAARGEDGSLVLSNGRFRFVFSQETGLLRGALCEGSCLLASGPHLVATRLQLEPWSGAFGEPVLEAGKARIAITGAYGRVCAVRFDLEIGSDGALRTGCHILSAAREMPHRVKAVIGLDPGGLDELGIAYMLPPGAKRLTWRRDARWEGYPAGHVGRPSGEAAPEDIRDFTAMRHHIRHARVLFESGAVEAISDGSHSLRLSIAPDERFVIDDRDRRIRYFGAWHEMDDACGNYRGTESLSRTPGDAFECDFNGVGIGIFGPTDLLHGIARVLVDGEERGRFSQYPSPADFPGMSRGYEKRYGVKLFEVGDLPDGAHTLRVEVTGEREAGAQDAYIALDRLVVASPGARPRVLMAIDSGFNYARLVRGNYMREALTFAAGDSFRSLIRLGLSGQGGKVR
ncbi:MAG: hypothetical protein LBJ10_10900 [Clostridiales bacterium]|jgi:hypothetical protein|nr:hypothetical protein [Clostridiales bacterium]